jgi:hypothetical protein
MRSPETNHIPRASPILPAMLNASYSYVNPAVYLGKDLKKPDLNPPSGVRGSILQIIVCLFSIFYLPMVDV